MLKNCIERKSTYEDLARDAIAAVQAIKQHKNVNPKQIGLWGNSEGGWTAPIAASLSTDVAFLIIRSGSALPPWKTVLHEMEGRLRDGSGLSEQEMKEAIAFKLLVEKIARTEENWDKAWSEIETAYSKAQKEKWLQYVAVPPKDHWFWHWWRLRGNYDPTPFLEQIRIPVLVLLGELDWAIPPKESAIAFEQAFKKARNKSYEIVVLPKANHGHLEAETGYFSEFPRLNRNVSGYMDKMASWVLEKTKKRPVSEKLKSK